MIWKLELGGMELGTPDALTPTPSKHAECSESWLSSYELLIRMCFVLCLAKYHSLLEKGLIELWILFRTGRNVHHICEA